MFGMAVAFDHSISAWDMSRVRDRNLMFLGATAFLEKFSQIRETLKNEATEKRETLKKKAIERRETLEKAAIQKRETLKKEAIEKRKTLMRQP